MQSAKQQFKIQNLYFLIIVFSFAFLVFNFNKAQAAKLFFDSKIQEVGINQEFQVDLILDAEKEDINAVEGKIVFPANPLELKEIKDGDSIVNFWIEQPTQKNGEIKFSGIIPGGFSGVLSPYYKGGRPGKVFSMIFAAKKERSGAIEVRDAKVLLNDGNGTPAPLNISSFMFHVSGLIPDTKYKISDTILKDTDPPELFTPEITSDPDIFDGKWFLVFAAQDKMSGTSGYFVHETTQKKDITQINTNDWIAAKSPYLLIDQKLKSYVYVKAIDKAGNARIVYLPPAVPWYKKWLVHIIVGIFGFAVLLLVIRWLWKKLKIIH